MIERDIRDALARGDGRPIVIGLCGAQGSGKSTAAAQVHAALTADGIRSVALSLDDFYLTSAERTALGEAVHSLLRTRGVPGTHDVALAMTMLDLLQSGEPVRLPCFDKTRDERATTAQWQVAPAGVQVILFEGWCVGARPQSDAALAEPVNALEAEQDRSGSWRRFVNDQLAGPYQRLFARLDRLVLLEAPGFEVVGAWRTEQEEGLRRETGNGVWAGMSDAEIHTFIQHYERLTRHILDEMPRRADLVITLDEKRAVIRAKHAAYI
ncbi:kinase [Sphingomonas sp. JC676]|nr:kinase [Sphingomonas sp. JC676]MBC9035091.1 kinase [Sphingomonas sp. JC676]